MIARASHLFLPTLRDAPADAEAVSHKLLVRAGLIRQLAAGIYSILPLGWRASRKIEAIVREEMDKIGAQEFRLPAMHPAELWQRSGRWTGLAAMSAAKSSLASVWAPCWPSAWLSWASLTPC